MPAPARPGPVALRPTTSHLGAAVLAALGCAAFSGQDILAKWLTAGYPLPQIMGTISLFALLPIVTVAALQGGLGTLRPQRWRLHLLRGVIYLIAMAGGFFAYQRMPIADAYAVLFTAPLIMTALSGPLLGETVGWRRWSAVMVGFVGLLVMVRPGFGTVDIGMIGVMIAAVSIALAAVIVRIGRYSEHGISFAFTTSCLVVATTALALPFGFVVPSWTDLALFAAAGILGGLAKATTIIAYTMAPIAIVAPFPYTQLVWGAILGYLVFGDLPATTTYIGAALVTGSGLYILWREARSGRGAAGAVGQGRT